MSVDQKPAVTPSVVNTRQALVAAIAAVLGFLLAAVWSYELVDDVIGHGIASFFLGDDAAAGASFLGSVATATVTGLAGTLTACNVACFASMGPLAAGASRSGANRRTLVTRTARQLVWLAAGMAAVAAVYGMFIVIAGNSAPMLSDSMIGGVPARLAQASVVNVVLGLGLLAVAVRFLRERALPGGNYGTLALGGLLGLLIVGRPFPMFRDVLGDAAANGNALRGGLLVLLVVVGNLVLLAVLLLGTMALAGPSIQRLMTRNPGLVMRIGGALLMVLAVFSMAYWGLRVPAMFGIGWFPELG